MPKDKPPVTEQTAPEPEATGETTATGSEEAPSDRKGDREKAYTARLYPGPDGQVPAQFAQAVRRLEARLEMPVWLLVQNGQGKYGDMDDDLYDAFFEARGDLPSSEPVALLIHSGGGMAEEAYKIARLVRRECGGFVAIVPLYAKSAATLLCLGAVAILMGKHAELGPLDAQLMDPDREDYGSALDEVQALERLHASALMAISEAVIFIRRSSGKRIDTVLPWVLEYVANMMRPLLEQINMVHYNKMARVLKVAEEYAIRLLQPNYPQRAPERIARDLVERYPEHGFFIDVNEACKLGLRAQEVPEDAASEIDAIIPFLRNITAIGPVEDASDRHRADRGGQ